MRRAALTRSPASLACAHRRSRPSAYLPQYGVGANDSMLEDKECATLFLNYAYESRFKWESGNTAPPDVFKVRLPRTFGKTQHNPQRGA